MSNIIDDAFVIRDGVLVPKADVEPLESTLSKPDRAYILKAKKTDWETPHWLFDKLWEEVNGFDLDPCASLQERTAKKIWGCTLDGQVFVAPGTDITTYKRAAIDGLKQDWFGKVYMNPPYGDDEVDWIAKAYKETQCGNVDVVYGLLPVRTDTIRWHKYIHGKTEIRFLKGRLRFVGALASAPFPSCIVIWRK